MFPNMFCHPTFGIFYVSHNDYLYWAAPHEGLMVNILLLQVKGQETEYSDPAPLNQQSLLSRPPLGGAGIQTVFTVCV